MGISRNLFISIAFHCMLISAVIGAGSRGKAVIPTERLITVLLLSQPEERVMPEKNVSAPAPSQMSSPPVTSAPNPFPLPKKIPDKAQAVTPAEVAAPGTETAVPERINAIPAVPTGDSAGDVSPESTGAKDTGHPGVSRGDIGAVAKSRGRSEGIYIIPSGDLPPARGTGADLIGTIRRAIDQAKHYPLIAKRRGVEGTVSLAFTINGRGQPENVRVVKSSGSDILDAAALKTVSAAAPLPVIEGVLEIPIVYRIDH